MSFVVDAYRKVTISLGGRCPIACRHCYTTTQQFNHDQPATPASVLAELGNVTTAFDVICISGDTDCFLDEDAGLELITGAARGFPDADIMFTTRLVPDDSVVSALSELTAEMSERRRLLLPGISLVSMQVPNFSERSRLIPSADLRLRFLARLAASGMACMLALRPTLPFRLVAPEDVQTMIGRAANNASAVLGEVMLMDTDGQLAGRLGIPLSSMDDRHGQMTFLSQAASWHKRTFHPEVAYAAEVCRDNKVPYFLRSGLALAFIRQHWDWELGALDPAARIAGDWTVDAPDP